MLKAIPNDSGYIPFKTYCQIPAEYKDGLNQELLHINLNREKILSFALIIISLPLLYRDISAFNDYNSSPPLLKSIVHIHAVMLIMPMIFLSLIYFGENSKLINNPVLKRTMHLAINMVTLTLCSFLAVIAWTENELPFSYVITMSCIASTVFLTFCERVLLLFIPHIFFVTGLLAIESNDYKLIGNISFSTLLMILALIVSELNFSGYLKNYINKKVIMEKTRELDNMYKITKETLKKRTQELAEAIEYEKLRTAFFANISHELRTPLNVIFSAEQMMEFILKNEGAQGSEKEAGEYMRMIKQNCYRLIRLIANLIDTTKIDSGYYQLNPGNCDIVRVVEDITLSVAKFIEDKNIDLIFDTDMEEKIIACDMDKIERVMLNLLSNAVKFTPTGGSIYVNMYERDKKVVVSVKDTGIGIPYNMQKLIFEKFVQVDETISRNREGSGIGLSIVKSIVEMHGGTINLVSEPGKGSEFILEFPDVSLPSAECIESCKVIEGNSVERISIEFSDIYF